MLFSRLLPFSIPQIRAYVPDLRDLRAFKITSSSSFIEPSLPFSNAGQPDDSELQTDSDRRDNMMHSAGKQSAWLAFGKRPSNGFTSSEVS
jgi:hypothetical protein